MGNFIPLPTTQQELLEKGRKGNFSLYFSRMTPWQDEAHSKKLQKTKDGVQDLQKAYRDRASAAAHALENIHRRQGAALRSFSGQGGRENYEVFEITAQLTAPFVSGLGAFHPTETGFVLDRNTGLPYIPASSVKGVLRLAMAVLIADSLGDDWVDENDERLVKWFGTTDPSSKEGKRGQFIVLDSYPLRAATSLGIDILNPHYESYYKGNNGPVETDNPIPVKFLRVERMTRFVFRCMLPSDLATDAAMEVRKLFDCALTRIGLGAKSSAGYGFFEIIGVKNGPELLAEARPAWAREFERVVSQVSDWNTLRNLMERQNVKEHKNETFVAESVGRLATEIARKKRSQWTKEKESLVATWLTPGLPGWESGVVVEKPEETCPQLSPEQEQYRIEINQLKNWGDYTRSSISINELGIECVKDLKKKLKEFGCKNRRASSAKKKVWKTLSRREQQLQ